ncbi:MAG: tyramine oxidase, partial [Candidatus Dormibacteraeota bacterium]|nr:tyramine oxidase [Candidatus Dormibacteraeota bacterium]
MQTADSSITAVRHPLDPLTPAEIESATSVLKRERGLGPSARFVYVTLQEPAKETVLSFRDGDPIDREAFVVLRDRERRRSYEAVVSVSRGEVRSWRELAGVQPPIMFEEFLAAEEAVKKDPRWQDALRRRG